MGFENERAWYIVQTYSGCENAAKNYLERRIESMNMQDYIFRVVIPEVKHYEKKKNGEQKEIIEKVYPGYVFVDMIVTDESWFVVRNTPMVTGFLGSSGGGAKPVPLLPDEINPILKGAGIERDVVLRVKVGQKVKIVAGSFNGSEAVVDTIDTTRKVITVLIDLFGRQSPAELQYDEVEPAK
jgi:transcriptional antiterminator NusG